MSGSGQETLPDVPEFWEAFLDVRQLSGGPLDVREALPIVRESLGDTPGCPRVVGTPSQMSECSGGPPGCLAVIGRPS